MASSYKLGTLLDSAAVRRSEENGEFGHADKRTVSVIRLYVPFLNRKMTGSTTEGISKEGSTLFPVFQF